MGKLLRGDADIAPLLGHSRPLPWERGPEPCTALLHLLIGVHHLLVGLQPMKARRVGDGP